MNGRPPRFTRTHTLCPYTTLFRSALGKERTASVPLAAPRLAPCRALAGSRPLVLRPLARPLCSTAAQGRAWRVLRRSEEHTSELQSLMRISYAVFCLKKTNNTYTKSQRQVPFHKSL